MSNKPFVAILMGSDSDLEIMRESMHILKKISIQYEVRINSAHRTPEEVKQYVLDAENRGAQVFIAGAGLAAHLAGAIASQTIRPVIGVPLDAGSLGGLDALLSTVQMPAGIPVATVAIGKAGARNAAWLTAQIMGLHDVEIVAKIKQQRLDDAQKLVQKNRDLTL